MSKFLWFSLLLEALHTNYAFANENQDIQIKNIETNGIISVMLTNKSIIPYTVHLKVMGYNIDSGCLNGCYFNISGKEKLKLDEISPRDSRRNWRYRTKYTTTMGSRVGRYDQDYIYLPPFAHGKKFLLGQGFNGNFSHKGDNQYAIDFTMPKGSQVHAARDGKVISVIEHFKEGGVSSTYKDKANHIMIMHADGTIGNYAHLQFNGSVVNQGENVERGQLLGYSGDTGYSSGPHLHFSIFRLNTNAERESLPFLIKSRNGNAEEPKQTYYYSIHEGQPKVDEIYADELDFQQYYLRSTPVMDISTVKDRVEEIDDYVLVYLQNGKAQAIELEFTAKLNGFENFQPVEEKITIPGKTEKLLTVLKPIHEVKDKRYSYRFSYRELNF